MKKWLLMLGFVGCAALYSCEYETTREDGFTQTEGTEEVQPEEEVEVEEEEFEEQEVDTTARIEDGGYELDTEEDVM